MMNTEMKRIEVTDSVNERFYIELPDGYRLVYDDSGYAGRYDPMLSEVLKA